jgi:hypothetical protein
MEVNIIGEGEIIDVAEEEVVMINMDETKGKNNIKGLRRGIR